MSVLPLPSVLSQALVAFTIEFDNEAEHRLPHWTTSAGRTASPRESTWLVSQVMWANVLRYIDDDGVRYDELVERARTSRLSLGGLKRWRYIALDPDSGTGRGGSAGIKLGDETLVRLTPAGRRACEVWRPLAAEIETRWASRFGPHAVTDLRESLGAVRDRFDPDVPLPRYLPVVYPTQNGKAEVPVRAGGPQDAAAAGADRANGATGAGGAAGAARTAGAAPGREDAPGGEDVSVLLSQVLLRFTLDFEVESRISLPISANTLRVLDGAGVRVRDLPALTGVSKEANSMTLGFLQRFGCVVLETDPSTGRGKVIRLTEKGLRAQAKYVRVLRATEVRWEAEFGSDAVERLRRSLEQLLGDAALISQGIRPYPDGWRASVRPPATLPHYPMVLHRGGFPDGS